MPWEGCGSEKHSRRANSCSEVGKCSCVKGSQQEFAYANSCRVGRRANSCYVAAGDAEGLAEGLGMAALSMVALIAFKSTMEVYLLSSE